MTITDDMVERALEAWRKVIRLQLICDDPEHPEEVTTCKVIPRTEAPAIRAALEAALSGQAKEK